MRIVQCYKVYRPDTNGGVPEVMSQIARLANFGDQTSVLAARHEAGVALSRTVDDTPVRAVFSFGQVLSTPLAPTFPFALTQAARNCDLLALHAPFPLNDLPVAFGLIPDRVAVVLHWHAELSKFRVVSQAVMPFVRRTVKRADSIIVSDESLIENSPLLTANRHKCVVIPYGCDVIYWSSLDANQVQKAALLRAQHPRLVVTTGRLVPYKGYRVLLHAMKQLNAELVIIGEGGEREKLQALAQELSVADRVKFKGFLPRDEIKVYYHAARLFVLPSIAPAEAFGLVQIEAMAAGLPIINTQLPTAVPKVARHEREAITVDPGDAFQLARATSRVLDDHLLAKKLAAAGQERATTEYASSMFVGRVREAYQSALLKRMDQHSRALQRP
jgi:rhamnosyl/mannosyltransferase